MLTLGGVGLGLAIATATELVTLYPAGHATDHRGRRAVLIPALAGLAAITAVFGLASTPLMFMIAMGLLGVASGYAGVPPAPMLSDVTPQELKGTAVAVFRFSGDLGFVIGPLVAGWSANAFGFTGAFLVNAIPAVVALGLVVSIRETLPSRRALRGMGPACSHAVRVLTRAGRGVGRAPVPAGAAWAFAIRWEEQPEWIRDAVWVRSSRPNAKAWARGSRFATVSSASRRSPSSSR